jgi:hypothetical protein
LSIVFKFVSLNLLEPSEPVPACNGLEYQDSFLGVKAAGA